MTPVDTIDRQRQQRSVEAVVLRLESAAVVLEVHALDRLPVDGFAQLVDIIKVAGRVLPSHFGCLAASFFSRISPQKQSTIKRDLAVA